LDGIGLDQFEGLAAGGIDPVDRVDRAAVEEDRPDDPSHRPRPSFLRRSAARSAGSGRSS
jgi:hypothetical protein